MSRATWMLTAVAAVALTVMAASMPPHGFFSGDSGVKLIVARNAAADAAWPPRVALPDIAGQPAPAFMEPFFLVHDDHAHGVTSSLLPLLSAPLIAAFGLRGAYVIPLLSFVALVPLLTIAQRRLGLVPAPVMLGVLAILASPLLFYSLELWEHVPAVAALTAATALGWGRRRAEQAAAGLCLATAVLFRPEAAWYAAALAVALLWTRRDLTAVLTIAAGTIAGLAIPLGLNYAHSGSPLEPHIAVNAGALEGGWLASRAQIAAAWFAPLPAIPRQAIWQWTPLLLLAAVPATRSAATSALRVMAVICLAGVLLTVPNDGGAQWGPRYLLVAVPVLLLLAADTASALWRRPHRLFAAAVVAIVLLGVMSSRAAYRELRGSKQVYAALTDALDRARGDTLVIVTDLWWLDQVTAALYPRVTFLYVDSNERAREVAARLSAVQADFLVAASGSESPVFMPGVPWFSGGCGAPALVATLNVRDLALYGAGC
jgi:hypothetical protein